MRRSSTPRLAAGEEVIQCQHRVRLAAAKIGLELHHRIAPRAGESMHCADEELRQAFGEESAAEELDRLAVFV